MEAPDPFVAPVTFVWITVQLYVVPTISLVNTILVDDNVQMVFADAVAVATGIGLITTGVVVTTGEHPHAVAMVY